MADFPLATKGMHLHWEALKKAPDYRQFLKTYLEIHDLKYSDLARMAGFGRGFPSDVVSGRRRLTAKSFYAFENSLKLPAAGKKLFRLLVAKEEKEIFPELKKQHHQIDALIEEVRKKTSLVPRRELVGAKNPDIESLIQNPQVMSVYAASGEPGKGASFENICKRTQLDRVQIQKAIQELERVGLLCEKGGLYEPKDLHIFFKSIDSSAVVISTFKQACRAAAQRAELAMKSNEEFFFASQFCIDQAKMPELKKALRETILKFVDESITADGDRVVQLLAGLHLPIK